MSIVALKRNSRRFKAPISGRGRNGFSLCGGTRNQGWVGQGVRGRALGGTPFRGTVPMGNGGCCGKYVVNVVNSAACCTNDAAIIKKTSINQPGYISRSLTPRSTIPFSRSDAPKCCGGGIIWVKGVGALDHGHHNHIARKRAGSAGCVTRKPDAGRASCDKCGKADKVSCKCSCAYRSHFIGGRKIFVGPYGKDINVHPISQGQYLGAGALRKHSLPTPSCKQAWPPRLSSSGPCESKVVYPSEAIEAGLLPKDWGKCKACPRPGLPVKLPPQSQCIKPGTSVASYTSGEIDLLGGQFVPA